MALRAVLVVLLLAAPALSGCSDFFDQFNRPDYHVRVTPMDTSGWNREGRFEVQVEEDQPVHIEATATDGRSVSADGQRGAVLNIPDGTWDLTYRINGHKWGGFSGLRIDGTPPTLTGLQRIANAPDGHYALGQGASVSGSIALQVVDLQTGAVVGTSLPVTLNALSDGLHAYLVSARDEAGNFANATVQVRVGAAVDLPAGTYTFGIVARYSNDLILWDIANPGSYATVAQASQQTGGHFLSAGYGVTPDDAAVKQVVAQVVTSDMTTTQRALALFRYMMENLHYDTSRLDNNNLLTPHQVLLDAEDPSGSDCTDPTGKAPDCDGLIMDGAGNGVRGGICRDLAGTYVSLLRAAKVPARLVSGYVAGTVNGFHAWVEFYGGTPAGHSGQSPWIPVDVSIVDGTFKDSALLQSFGIQLPEYLTLREIPEASEVEGWSTALGVHYSFPNAGSPPDITFEKTVTPSSTTTGVLCFDSQTHERHAADSKSACGGSPFYLDHFTLSTTRIMDYGVLVRSAPHGTQVKAEVGYPFPESARPNLVDFDFYGKPVTRLDQVGGKADADFTV